MGAASSTLSSQSFSQKAQLGKKLPDEILNVFFKQADFKDLLSLSSLEACPTYIFTTAEALDTLFQKLQVAPRLGKKGEILFAPLSEVAPGSVKDARESDTEKAKRIQERNTICMEVAYFYVRIFQIYAALALTVIEADPVRRPQARAALPGARGVREAVFFGGGFQKSGTFLTDTQIARQTSWAPLEDYFTFKQEGSNKFLELDGLSRKVAFRIQWDVSKVNEGVFSAIFFMTESPAESIESEIKISTETKKSTLYIDNSPILPDASAKHTFIFDDASSKWVLDSKNAAAREIFISMITKYFVDKLREKSQEENKKAERARGGISSSSSSVSRPSVSRGPSGKSEFEGFPEIKDLFEKRFKGGAEFPKAYCIARAMTLLMPIFETERTNKNQPFYSQICRKQYDFEPLEFMPRPRFGSGRSPGQNIYFNSLIGLYYDDYYFSGGKVVFTQTETGRSDLKTASVLFAKLYNITKDQDTFLEKAVQFPAFPICQKTEALLQITDETFRKFLFTNIILPMIKIQEEHTVQVNALLKQMFEIKEGKLRFSTAIRQGGKEAVNAFGRKAHTLLRNYYLNSEAFYVRGMMLFEKPENQAFFKQVL